jgi:nucleoside 2-deoxyribosyltransferase
MKIYIAGPWVQKEDIAKIALQVEAEGHKITHKWWEVENGEELEANREPAELRRQGQLDLAGVMNADTVLLINSMKSEGKAVEQGIALGQDIPIIAVGKRGEHSNNVFHYLPNYRWVDDVEHAIEELQWIDAVKGMNV